MNVINHIKIKNNAPMIVSTDIKILFLNLAPLHNKNSEQLNSKELNLNTLKVIQNHIRV